MARAAIGENADVGNKGLVRLSRRMSRALRHAPDQFGLELDHAGWVPVDDFLAALRITRAELDAVVAGNDKQRFAVQRDANGTERIRASQGHSIQVDLGLVPQSPPQALYHGTAGRGTLKWPHRSSLSWPHLGPVAVGV